MRPDHLAVVLVRRDHIHVHILGGKLQRSGTDDVVSLKARHHQHWDIQRRNYLSQRLKRIYHQTRGFCPVGLVGRIEFIAEGSSRRVETYRKVGRLLLAYEFKEIFGETV